MSEFESFQVDLSANNVSDDDDMGAPVVRRRGPPKGVTFGENTTAPPNEQRINGCNGGGVEEELLPAVNGSGGFGESDGGFQSATDFMDDLDFLENCGGTNGDPSELQRKSLYVKFDPLCKSPAGKSPARSAAASAALSSQLSQATLGGSPKTDLAAEEDIFFTKRQPMSRDNNGYLDTNDTESEKNGRDSTNKNNSSFSLSDFSPAPVSTETASETQNNTTPIPPVLRNGDLVEPLLYTQTDMDEWIRKARDDFNEELRAHEVDWKSKYAELENGIKEEVAMRNLIEKDNAQKIEVLRRETTDMKQVLSQYEMTIVELTENSHLDARANEKSVEETVRAKEQMQEDLNTAEQAVFDAFKRIEKLKQTVDKLTTNEAALKRNSEELNTKLAKSEEKYDKLKTQAEQKIDSANTVIAKVRKQQEIDIAGLQASLKVAQLKVDGLEKEIQQKNVDNEQLTKLCDDLIAKVSQN